jgi:hypothetical protein
MHSTYFAVAHVGVDPDGIVIARDLRRVSREPARTGEDIGVFEFACTGPTATVRTIDYGGKLACERIDNRETADHGFMIVDVDHEVPPA